jgi:hypothetical protein
MRSTCTPLTGTPVLIDFPICWYFSSFPPSLWLGVGIYLLRDLRICRDSQSLKTRPRTPHRHSDAAQTPHRARHARVRSQPSLAQPSRSGMHRLNGTVHGSKRVCQTAKVSPYCNRRSSNLDWVHAPRSILATPRFTHRSQRTIGRRGLSFNKFLCGDLSQNNQGPFPGGAPVSPTLQPPFVAP